MYNDKLNDLETVFRSIDIMINVWSNLRSHGGKETYNAAFIDLILAYPKLSDDDKSKVQDKYNKSQTGRLVLEAMQHGIENNA